MLVLDNYQIKHSQRKSISACFDANGVLIVKAPINISTEKIDYFLEKNANAIWHLKQKTKHKIYLTSEIFSQNFKKFEALKLLKERFNAVHTHAQKLNLTTEIPPTYKIMQSRWGSCKTNGVICLNLFLGLLPEHLIDAVIAHEFCHLSEMNHSKRFYDLLLKLYPNYKECDKELRNYIIKK
jgi:predicted metal-dependent hydrolase